MSPVQPSSRLFRPASRGLAAIFLVSLLSACNNGEEQSAGFSMPPPLVSVSSVAPESISHYQNYLGQLRGIREVEVRAQVDGILEQRHFLEGSAVIAGQQLFQIEAEPYELALQQAQAQLDDAEAARTQAEREWTRLSRLLERNAVSQRDLDQAESVLEMAEARLAGSRVAVADAERNLRYTRVEAPLSGISSMESLSEGSLVNAGTLLTRINQQDRLQALFSVPEQDAVRLRQLWQQSATDSPGAWLQLRDGSIYEHGGRIDFSSSSLDPATASLSLRAEFPNPDNALLPGQFVRVRLLLNEFDSIFLVDPTAISQGDEGVRVFVLDDDGIAHSRAVELGPVIDAQQVILNGLRAGERLVINGHVSLQDGMQARLADEQNGDG